MTRDKSDPRIEVAKQMAAAFLRDARGQGTQNSAMRVVGLVVALTVGGIVAAFLLPIAIEELVNVTTTDWSDGASALWGILDVIVVLAVFLAFIGIALAAANDV